MPPPVHSLTTQVQQMWSLVFPNLGQLLSRIFNRSKIMKQLMARHLTIPPRIRQMVVVSLTKARYTSHPRVLLQNNSYLSTHQWEMSWVQRAAHLNPLKPDIIMERQQLAKRTLPRDSQLASRHIKLSVVTITNPILWRKHRKLLLLLLLLGRALLGLWVCLHCNLPG